MMWATLLIHVLSVPASLLILVISIFVSMRSPPPAVSVALLAVIACLSLLILAYEYVGRVILELAAIAGLFMLGLDLGYPEKWFEPTRWVDGLRRYWLLLLLGVEVGASMARLLNILRPWGDMIAFAASLDVLLLFHYELRPRNKEPQTLEGSIVALAGAASFLKCLTATVVDMLVAAPILAGCLWVQNVVLPRLHAEHQLRETLRTANPTRASVNALLRALQMHAGAASDSTSDAVRNAAEHLRVWLELGSFVSSSIEDVDSGALSSTLQHASNMTGTVLGSDRAHRFQACVRAAHEKLLEASRFQELVTDVREAVTHLDVPLLHERLGRAAAADITLPSDLRISANKLLEQKRVYEEILGRLQAAQELPTIDLNWKELDLDLKTLQELPFSPPDVIVKKASRSMDNAKRFEAILPKIYKGLTNGGLYDTAKWAELSEEAKSIGIPSETLEQINSMLKNSELKDAAVLNLDKAMQCPLGLIDQKVWMRLASADPEPSLPSSLHSTRFAYPSSPPCDGHMWQELSRCLKVAEQPDLYVDQKILNSARQRLSAASECHLKLATLYSMVEGFEDSIDVMQLRLEIYTATLVGVPEADIALANLRMMMCRSLKHMEQRELGTLIEEVQSYLKNSSEDAEPRLQTTKSFQSLAPRLVSDAIRVKERKANFESCRANLDQVRRRSPCECSIDGLDTAIKAFIQAGGGDTLELEAAKEYLELLNRRAELQDDIRHYHERVGRLTSEDILKLLQDAEAYHVSAEEIETVRQMLREAREHESAKAQLEQQLDIPRDEMNDTLALEQCIEEGEKAGVSEMLISDAKARLKFIITRREAEKTLKESMAGLLNYLDLRKIEAAYEKAKAASAAKPLLEEAEQKMDQVKHLNHTVKEAGKAEAQLAEIMGKDFAQLDRSTVSEALKQAEMHLESLKSIELSREVSFLEGKIAECTKLLSLVKKRDSAEHDLRKVIQGLTIYLKADVIKEKLKVAEEHDANAALISEARLCLGRLEAMDRIRQRMKKALDALETEGKRQRIQYQTLKDALDDAKVLKEDAHDAGLKVSEELLCQLIETIDMAGSLLKTANARDAIEKEVEQMMRKPLDAIDAGELSDLLDRATHHSHDNDSVKVSVPLVRKGKNILSRLRERERLLNILHKHLAATHKASQVWINDMKKFLDEAHKNKDLPPGIVKEATQALAKAEAEQQEQKRQKEQHGPKVTRTDIKIPQHWEQTLKTVHGQANARLKKVTLQPPG